MLDAGWSGAVSLETDLSGPVKVTFLCQARSVNCLMGIIVDGNLVPTLLVPHTTWHPVEVHLPGPSAMFGILLHGQGVVWLDRFVVTPVAANALAAMSSEANSLPPLKPNQPTHNMPAPNAV